MRVSHEFGQRGAAEDGVVGCLEVSDLELDVLGAVVFLGLEVTGSTTCPRGTAVLPGTMP